MSNRAPDSLEPFCTMKEFAAALNLKYSRVRRAVKNGTLPSYRLDKNTIRLRLSEAAAVYESTREGGQS